MKDEITINLKPLELIKKEGDRFLIDPKAEEALMKFLEFKRTLEELEEHIKERLNEAMARMNTVKIEGEAVKVLKRYFGDRYAISDPKLAKELGFAFEEVKLKIDSEAVEQFQKQTGELPEGIMLRERTESVTILEVKPKDEIK